MTAITRTEVRKGRRLYGSRYLLPSGKQVYLAHRFMREMYRTGRKTMTEAVRDGVGCWALDEDTIMTERAKKTQYIGVLDKDTGAIWLTHLSLYLDRSKVKFVNYTARGGALQRTLAFEHFVLKPGVLRKL